MQNINLVEGEESDNEVMMLGDNSAAAPEAVAAPREHIIPIRMEGSSPDHDVQLKELGLFEEGMTAEQKQELLQVVAASKEAAGGENSDFKRDSSTSTARESYCTFSEAETRTPLRLKGPRPSKKKNKVSEEQSINQQLLQLGLYEDGMSLEQKKEILQVVEASRETAEQEESKRRGHTPSTRPPSYTQVFGNRTGGPSSEGEENYWGFTEDDSHSSAQRVAQSDEKNEAEDEEAILEDCSSAEEVQEGEDTWLAKETAAAGDSLSAHPSDWSTDPPSPELRPSRRFSSKTIKEELPYFWNEECGVSRDEHAHKVRESLDLFHAQLRETQEKVGSKCPWDQSSVKTFHYSSNKKKRFGKKVKMSEEQAINLQLLQLGLFDSHSENLPLELKKDILAQHKTKQPSLLHSSSESSLLPLPQTAIPQ